MRGVEAVNGVVVEDLGFVGGVREDCRCACQWFASLEGRER